MYPTTIWQVELFVDDRGRDVVADFIRGLSPRDKAKALYAIRLLEEFGIDLHRPHAGYLEDGLWELIGGKHVRLIYSHLRERRFLVWHGFWKTQKKTPPGEIDTAKRRREWFNTREGK